ncbi:MAG: ribbon-helix-helix domain-containing protein, partial [Steroidobacter sp.]
TRVPTAAYVREAIDDLLTKYGIAPKAPAKRGK